VVIKSHQITKYGVLLATVLPFMIRVFDGREVFQLSWKAIICNVLLSFHSLWLWWCLCEVIYKKVLVDSVDDLGLGENFFQHTDKGRDRSDNVPQLRQTNKLLHSVYSLLHKLRDERGISLDPHVRGQGGIKHNLFLDISTTRTNLDAFLTCFRILGKTSQWNGQGLQCFVQCIVMIQVFVSISFFARTVFASETITAAIAAYIVFETIFLMIVLRGVLVNTLKVNKIDERAASLCREIATLLPPGAIDANLRLRNIAVFLDKHRAYEAKLFVVLITNELVAKLMASFLAATLSALLRMGLG